jgi:hypothetical protein
MPDSVAVLYVGSQEKVKIPKGKFTVHTANSVYLLGRQNKKSWRSIERLSTDLKKHSSPLEFTKCKVRDITIQCMNVDCFDGPFKKIGWHTSMVLGVGKFKPKTAV